MAEAAALDADRALDVLRHGERYRPDVVRWVADVTRRLWTMPYTTEQAAGVLGVTKPTVLAWLRAGILDPHPRSTASKHFLYPAQVHAARAVLDRAQVRGSLEERAARLRALLEDVYWAAHPSEHDALTRAIAQADAGEGVAADDFFRALDEEFGPPPSSPAAASEAADPA